MPQQSPRVVATIIWAALLAGPTLFLGVALYLVYGLGGGVGLGAPLGAEPALIAGSLVLSAITVALSWLWAVRMARPAQAGGGARGGGGAIPAGPEADAITRLIVACALCEGGALAAVVVFLLTGNALALAIYALSWIALAAHFPGDRQWAQLTGLPAGVRQSRMIRG